MTKRGGFTLIEVLVVIAIIGILAALVIIGVNKSRARATDARIESSVRQLRVLAEDYFVANGLSYAGWETCITAATSSATTCRGASIYDGVTKLTNDIDTATTSTDSVTTNAVKEDLCMSVELTAAANQHICTTASGIHTTGASTSAPCDPGPPPVCTFSP